MVKMEVKEPSAEAVRMVCAEPVPMPAQLIAAALIDELRAMQADVSSSEAHELAVAITQIQLGMTMVAFVIEKA